MNVLHITHTDIITDSRILKEMQSISNINEEYYLKGIGVSIDEGSKSTSNIDGIEINSIVLRTRGWVFLPRLFRHTFSLIELTSKMFFNAIKTKPKVVHCHDTLVLPLGYLVKIFTGAKLIYDAHELESDRNGISSILSKLTIFVEKLLWSKINALIVVSPSIKKWYNDTISSKLTEVILNSPILDKSIELKEKNYLRKKFNISEESKIFLYIGILGNGRGIDLITDVYKDNDLSSSLVFLGYGELSEELKDLQKKYPNIYVHDAVPHEEVVSIAQSADFGLCLIQNVSLSDYYCLPNKLFEYSFAGIPILASNFPDITSTVKKFNLGRTCDLDKNSILKAIKSLENKNEVNEIDIDGLYELSWEAQEEKLVKLYKKLLDGEK